MISGGLDSMLAARLVQGLGVHVEGINFYTGFCIEGHTQALRARHRSGPKRHQALWVAEQLGIRLHLVDVAEAYKKVVLQPKYGYGAHLNPCLDCKIFMVRRAMCWLEEHGFDFIVTGEVVGQRPKSQRSENMSLIGQKSGAGERLVRPLCARNLPATLPEREGWIRRERLLGFSGRSRKPQMALAARLGLHRYAQPAGGCCFLTNERYAAKLNDLWKFRGTRDYEIDDIVLLKVGRHLRPRPHFKLIIAREEAENHFLEGYRHRFVHLRTVSHEGPLTLLDGTIDEDDLALAARITARYSQGREANEVLVVAGSGTRSRPLLVTPLTAEQIPSAWHI